MAKKRAFIPNGLKPWIDARQRFRLSHAHIQMARELGMNPKKFWKLANHRQEPWKLPLPEFIAELYFERFGKSMPDIVRTIEETAAAKLEKKRRRRENRMHGEAPRQEASRQDVRIPGPQGFGLVGGHNK